MSSCIFFLFSGSVFQHRTTALWLGLGWCMRIYLSVVDIGLLFNRISDNPSALNVHLPDPAADDQQIL